MAAPRTRNLTRGQPQLVPINDRGHAELPSGERIANRFTPTGRDKRDSGARFTSGQIRAATGKRKAWEASAVGQERTKGITPETHGVTPGQFWTEYQYDHVSTGPRHYDVQLPGMADPNAAPRPPKWDELSDQQRQAAERGARAHGTSLEQITRDLGAQVDQAGLRAARRGSRMPHGQDFYSTGEPRKVVDATADRLGIPRVIHHHMNAITSPQVTFSDTNKITGEISYPNNEAAEHAVRYVQKRGSEKGISTDMRTTGVGSGKTQAYAENIEKAASSFRQHRDGIPAVDWVTSEKGTGPFDNAPKTSVYTNTWNDTHPQFTVSDVHTGGGGGLPHLSSGKPQQRDASGAVKLDKSGNPKSDSSEREKAMASIPHYHSMMDHAMRSVITQRGIGSIREGQGAQWGEERIQRGLISEDEAYPRDVPKQIEGQQPLGLALVDEVKGAKRKSKNDPGEGQMRWDFV
jgi:hypothetical protein